MKRTILSLLLLMGLSMVNNQWSTAFAQNNAMFIYRNDGEINAFLKADIDSIRHSALDLDSMLHAENVVQEVWTVDSVYRIPLAVIDSVSFITPPTVYKEDVNRLEYNLLDYIIGADGHTLKLKLNTPTMLLPVKGDKLVLLDGCEALPYGFSGIVSNVKRSSSSFDVVCEQAYLEDLFDSFCSVSTSYGCNPDSLNADSPSSRRRVTYNPRDLVMPLGPFKIDISNEVSQGFAFDDDLAVKGGISASTEVQPTFRIHTFLRYGFDEPETYFQCSITGDLRVTTQMSIYGGLDFEKDIIDKPIVEIPIPYTAKLINFYIVSGAFVRANATVSSTVASTQVYTFGMTFDYSSKGQNSVKPHHGGRLASSSLDMTGSLDGSVAGGTFLETGFNLLCRDIAKVCVRGEYGRRLSGNFVLRNSEIEEASEETKLYERLKGSSIELSEFVNASLQASVPFFSHSRTWEATLPIFSWNLVPEFSNTKLKRTPGQSNSADAYTEVSGTCLFPVGVGYKLFDDDKNEVGNYDAGNSRVFSEGTKFGHTFSGLNESGKYKVYPKVNFMGFDILASPEAELNIIMPEIKEFRVTGSDYSKGAFYYEGSAYDYRFNAATTLEIESLEGIADWGYVYRDPNGKTKRISLMQFGTSYTDTRYDYYRNEPKSQVCLYPYVKYEGDTEYYDGEPQEYELKYSVPPLQFEELMWADMQYANDNVYVTMLAAVEIPTGQDVDLSTYESCGVCVTNYITGWEYYYDLQENGSMVFWIPLEIPRDEFEKDYDSFTATCDKILFSTYAVDEDGIIIWNDEREADIVYNVPPSVTYTKASITGIQVIERDEDNRPKRYRTDYSYGMDIIGAFWISAIQKRFYSTSTYGWNGSTNWATIPGDVSYSGNSAIEYDKDSNISHTEYIRMQLTDGSTLNSTNSLVFGGVPSNPTVYIGGEPSQTPAINVVREEVKEVFTSPFEIVKENAIIRNRITNKALEGR